MTAGEEGRLQGTRLWACVRQERGCGGEGMEKRRGPRPAGVLGLAVRRRKRLEEGFVG